MKISQSYKSAQNYRHKTIHIKSPCKNHEDCKKKTQRAQHNQRPKPRFFNKKDPKIREQKQYKNQQITKKFHLAHFITDYAQRVAPKHIFRVKFFNYGCFVFFYFLPLLNQRRIEPGIKVITLPMR